jgi:hypothetical protein
MTITLELTPEEQARLSDKAARFGLDVSSYLRRIVETEISPPAVPTGPLPGDRTREILAKWREEDDAMTPEEAAQAEAEWEELKANLNANRAATGERLLFP